MIAEPRPVLFASEYYPPFAPGGAEWTNAEWAKALARRGQPVVVVTANYGAPPRESADGVEVIRVPFPLKRRSGQGEVPALVHRNPLWNLYFAVCIAWIAYRRTPGRSTPRARALWSRPAGGAFARTAGAGHDPRPRTRLPAGPLHALRAVGRFDCSFRQYARNACASTSCTTVPAPASPDVGGSGRPSAGVAESCGRRRALNRVDRVIGVSRGILAVYPARVVPAAAAPRVLPPAVGARCRPTRKPRASAGSSASATARSCSTWASARSARARTCLFRRSTGSVRPFRARGSRSRARANRAAPRPDLHALACSHRPSSSRSIAAPRWSCRPRCGPSL